jgi:hypothetical protein
MLPLRMQQASVELYDPHSAQWTIR